MKKHKQRFEHKVEMVSGTYLEGYIGDAQQAGYELVCATKILHQKQTFYTLFFKRPI